MKTESIWKTWLERLYDLRRDKRGAYERPHKPVLLLAIIDEIDRGTVTDNQVRINDDLIASFKRQFEIVRKPGDQPTIQNPFFHLAGDKFWHLEPKESQDAIYRVGEAGGSPSLGELRRRVAFGFFDSGLWNLLKNPESRSELRDALIDRYFPEKRTDLLAHAAQELPAKVADELHEEFQHGRDTAFRRTILEIYDYRCAACGIRVLLESQLSLVEAAHLIPFNLSRNDRPDNGVALCPNHHWAMDRFLIAPCPDNRHSAGIWRVHPRLDDRIEGQKDLLALSDRPVIPPSEEKFLPAADSLKWRAERLVATG
jgi:putative restriction endonuclease